MIPHTVIMHPKLLDQPIISHRDEFMPECYAATMPHIRACKTSARWTSRLQVAGTSRSQGLAEKELGMRTEGHTFQESGYRQKARDYIRG